MLTRSALCLLLLIPSISSSQQFEAVRSYVLPEGEIRGMVLDATTDKPLAGATITVMGANRQARTNAKGRFIIRGIPDGSYELFAYQPGYEGGHASVQMVAVVGWAARFSLRVTRGLPQSCDLIDGNYARSIALVVRDALTGGAPIAPVALRVTDRFRISWDLRQAQPGDTAVELYAGSGAGPFHVEVASDGYAPWSGDEVAVELGRCDVPVQRKRNVWLLRTGSVDPARLYLPRDSQPGRRER